MKRADILARCLDDIESRRSTLADCVERYPEMADELRTLLGITASIRPEAEGPSFDFRQRARGQLLVEIEAQERRERHRDRRWWRPQFRLAEFSVAATVLALLVVTGGGTVYASRKSLPDEALYPLKTGLEQLQLTLTASAESKAELHLRLAERRVAEVADAANQGKKPITTAALTAASSELDKSIREISKTVPADSGALLGALVRSSFEQQVKLGELLATTPESMQPALKESLEASRRGSLIAQVAYANQDFLKRTPSVRDITLEGSRFKLVGTLESVDGATWNVGGVSLHNVRSPVGAPAPGGRVWIEGVVLNDETFLSVIEPQNDPTPSATSPVRIEGVFSGASQNGTVWRVGGIPVGVKENSSLPGEGHRVELQAASATAGLTVTRVAQNVTAEGQLEGRLVQVNPDTRRISVRAAGTDVEVNVDAAAIQNEMGNKLDMAELKSFEGTDVKISQPYRKDGRLHVREVYVEASRESTASKQSSTQSSRSSRR